MKSSAPVVRSISLVVLVALAAFALTESLAARRRSAPKQAPTYSVSTLPLPDNDTGDVPMDYITYDARTNSVWVPGGSTAVVDVVDATTHKIRQIPNFVTTEVQLANGNKRVFGPSAVSIGEGMVYIGNRGDSSVCSFNAVSLQPGPCARFDSRTDGVSYVAPTKEVWVTTPGDKSVRVLDAKTLEEKAKLTFEGNPEGYAVDAKRGRFYTNMEDKDLSLAIDLKSRKTVATWHPACGGGGPHGLGVDTKAGLLFVACDSSAEVLDAGHDGAVLSKISTGDGVDDIHYEPATHLLYVGAARAAKLTIARSDAKGHLTLVAEIPTQQGSRNATVSKDGTVFLAHGGQARMNTLVVVSPNGKS